MAEIECYGLMTEDWVKQFRKELQATPAADPIELHISSPGGLLGAGVTAYNLLKQSKREVHAYLDGDAFSAATLLVCAADYAEMPSNTLMMVHNPYLPILSPATLEEVEATLGYLRATRRQVVEIYKDKTGLAQTRLAKMMKDETYFTAAEAMEAGFVNNVTSMTPNVQNLSLDKYPVRDQQKLATMLKDRVIPSRDFQERLASYGVELK